MSQIVEPPVDREAQALAAVYRLLLQKAAERRAREAADTGSNNGSQTQSETIKKDG